MPWKTIKRDCKQSSGKKGSHVVVKKKKDGGTEQESCHTSEEKAKSAIRARHANEGRTVKFTRRSLRKLVREALGTGPSGIKNHPAYREVHFTRDGEVRYINDIADEATIAAVADLGEDPIPMGADVAVVMGANPGSKTVWMNSAEVLDLIEREGWHVPPPPAGSKPGFWDGKGKWLEDSDPLLSELPPLPPVSERRTFRVTKKQLRRIIREAIAMDSNRAYELIAMLEENGYSLFAVPASDKNQRAMDNTLAVYPGEFTREDLQQAIQIVQGRGV